MSYQKCPACDGWGNRASRVKQDKFVKCRACKGLGVLGFADVVPSLPFTPVNPLVPQPLPYMPYVGDPIGLTDGPWHPGIGLPSGTGIRVPSDGGAITVDSLICSPFLDSAPFGSGNSKIVFDGPLTQ